eukprot:2257795-Alexandrium_andersonii.AAC.1
MSITSTGVQNQASIGSKQAGQIAVATPTAGRHRGHRMAGDCRRWRRQWRGHPMLAGEAP